MEKSDIVMTMMSAYDTRLIVLSYLVAVIASYTALDLAGRVTASQGSSRKLWLIGGATAMGVGIWSMHFIAALAFSLPIPISYDISITLLSMVAAIVASGIALFVVSRPSMGLSQLMMGGVLMGAGVGAMHYTGMAAMRIEATLWYDHTLFAVSVLVAVVVSMVALWIAFLLRGETGSTAVLQKVVSALVMGGAIVGMHFTGQAASNFTPTNPTAVASHPMSMVADNSWLAVTIGVSTGLVLGLALLSSFLNKRSERSIPISKEASVLR